MEKQTFQIPDGCKAITMEQIGNQLVTTFEVESTFEDGDVVITENGRICIFKKYTGRNGFESYLSNSEQSNFGWNVNNFRLATPEEAQQLWDALAKQGKRWNPETKEVEPIRWRAKDDESYYFLDLGFIVVQAYECSHTLDDEHHKVGNYFRTKEQAEKAKAYIQKAYNDFWKEELK